MNDKKLESPIISQSMDVKSKLELIEEALLMNVTGGDPPPGTGSCGSDASCAGRGECYHDRCY